MSGRPYFAYSNFQLREMYSNNAEDISMLEQLLLELQHRKKIAAVTLRQEIEAQMDFLHSRKRMFLEEYCREHELIYIEDLDYPFSPDECIFLDGCIIDFVGEGPYEFRFLKSIAYWRGAVLSKGDIWANDQIFVIGRQGFEKQRLETAVSVSVKYDITIEFVAQEDFIGFLFNGELPSYQPKDPIILEYPGLSYLASIGFKWPEIRQGHSNSRLIGFEGSDHDLATKCGYSVRRGVRIRDRHRALDCGVRLLGLKVVAYHLAFLIRRNLKSLRMKDAVARWRQDLQWLYDTKYKLSRESFVWPAL